MLTANDRLVLVRVKLVRARAHLSALETEVTPLQGQNLWVVGTKEGEPTGRDYFNPRPLPIVPFNVPATACDVIQNLRSCLDHLAYQLACVGTPDADPSRFVSFPIFEDAERYESGKASRVAGMRPDTVKAIDALKPYKGGNDLLWRLHDLSNIEKHRLIVTLGCDHLFTGEEFEGGYWLKSEKPDFDGIFASENPEHRTLLPTLHQLAGLVDDVTNGFLPHLA
jgi:hypothetical protein